MNAALVNNIDITTNNKEIITISPENFSHLYIANLDEAGDEINYEINPQSSSLLANFFMVKILKENNQESFLALERLNSRKDIVKIRINFINGMSQEFELVKKRIVQEGILENLYEKTFYLEEDLCIIVSDKKIKYLENLFA